MSMTGEVRQREGWWKKRQRQNEKDRLKGKKDSESPRLI